MKCAMCGKDAPLSEKKYIRDFGSFVLIIKNVPCYKCSCGEVYYTAETLKKIDKIVEEVKKITVDEVVILKYNSDAA